MAEDVTAEDTAKNTVSHHLWAIAKELVQRTNADALLVYADALREIEADVELPSSARLILVERNEGDVESLSGKAEHVVHVPGIPLPRMDQVKIALLLAVSRGVLEATERVVCLTGAIQSPKIDTVLVSDVGDELSLQTRASTRALPSDVRTDVFDKVLDIAAQLAYEGREGKSVGVIFVLGDVEAVKPYTKQLILNPFRGYPAEQRNIGDPRLTETIKELSGLDGAFVIAGDGEVVSGGTYLRAGVAGEELPQGLGARHAAAAGITASTNAIAITVSESTSAVRVFKGGRIITELKKSM
jgi:DNA integrity scanning protein DisA with diadenylate cyclase activity